MIYQGLVINMEFIIKMDVGEVYMLMFLELYDLYVLFKEQNLFSIVFYDGLCCEVLEFVEFVFSFDVVFFCFYDGDKFVIIWWLIDFFGCFVKMNFIMLCDYFDQ